MINEKNKNIFQCLLKDRVGDIFNSYFYKNHLDVFDYYLIYENKIIDNYYYKIFYEFISKDKIQNRFPNEKINNNIKYFTSKDNFNLEKTNTITMINDKEKITDNILSVLPNNETNETKLDIEIKVIKKSCCIRYKRKISNCCDKCKNFFKGCCPACIGGVFGFVLSILIIGLFLFLMG